MSDVNFVEYGVNTTRLLDTGEDITSFGAENGNALGQVFALGFVIFLVFGLLLLGAGVIVWALNHLKKK